MLADVVRKSDRPGNFVGVACSAELVRYVLKD